MNLKECIELVKEILQSKIDIFLQYEEITNKMITCDTQELEYCIIQRQNLATEIDVLDKELCKLYLKSGEERLEQAAFNKIALGECPEELKDVFLIGQKLVSIISRISRKEEQVFAYIETQKEILLKSIKQQNTSVNANAAKYYNVSKHTDNNFTIFDNKY